MSQLVFKFPFKKKYYEQDFYVSSNNFSAYRLVEGWPNWPGKWVNVYGAKGSGKTHLSKILEKKIDKLLVINENQITNKTLEYLNELECLIIDRMTHVEYYYFWDEDFKDENGKSFTLDDIYKVLNVDILRGIQSGNKKIDKSKFNL